MIGVKDREACRTNVITGPEVLSSTAGRRIKGQKHRDGPTKVAGAAQPARQRDPVFTLTRRGLETRWFHWTRWELAVARALDRVPGERSPP